MLKPSYIEQLPKRLIELYSDVEIGIIAHMAERIKAQNMFIPSVQWQYQKLIEMGNFHSFIVEALASQLGTTRQEVERLMLEAGQKAIALDTTIYRKAGLSPPTISQSHGMQQVIRSGYDNTMGLFENLTRTTANTATNQFEQALDKTWLNVNSGAFSHTEATKIAIDDLASKGLKAIEYPSGHTDYLDVAVRRATVTGVNQTAAKVQEELADELDSDLVETTAHSGARPDHAEWQGKVFSRSGASKKYPPFRESTGYGTGAGLCGWNCRHSFFPFFEGSEPVYTQAELDELNAKNIEYNGKMYSEYEATQIQRGYERNIRRSKREIAAAKAADLPDVEQRAKASLAKYQRNQADFIKQTGLKRQYDREKVSFGGKNITKSLDKSVESGIMDTGAISGALNPDSKQAQNHAKNYYGSVRSMKTDATRIAENTGYKHTNIEKVKQHLFIKEHDLGGSKPERFYPSYDIAQSWQRLINGKNIQPHDYVLLKHEMAEATLMRRGLTQQQAHDKANKKYNYTDALEER